MKKILLIVLAFIAFTSCNHMVGSGNIATEKRETGNFKGISVGGAFEVELKWGPAISVSIEADDNLLDIIETKVRDGVLKISTKSNTNINNGHFKAYITAPEINQLRCSGAALVDALDEIKYNGKIILDVSGAGKIKAVVNAPEIDAEASGAGSIEVSGKTRAYTARASGSGEIKTADLKSENTTVSVTGAGSAQVHSSVSLNAKASGAGNIRYRGAGSVVQKTSGAGSISKED